MSRRRRGNARRANQRRQRAVSTQTQLESILKMPTNHDSNAVNSAARDLLKLGRKHRLGLPIGRRSWICRSCETSLRPGVNARVRVIEKMWKITCLSCGRVNRKGPNFTLNDGDLDEN